MGDLLAQYMEVSMENKIHCVIKKDDSLQGKMFSFLGLYGTSLGHPKSRALPVADLGILFKGSLKI